MYHTTSNYQPTSSYNTLESDVIEHFCQTLSTIEVLPFSNSGLV